MARTCASGAVDLGSIPSRVKPMTLKLVFTASMLDAQRAVWKKKNSNNKGHCGLDMG